MIRNNNKILIVIVLVLLAIGVCYLVQTNLTYSVPTGNGNATTTPNQVLSFEACAAAGYPIMESYPRQCRTPDGRTYAEEIQRPGDTFTYINASNANVVVDNPFPGAVVGKDFTVTGTARAWYFEGSFPVEVLDKNGNRLVQGIATAQTDWMVDAFVSFKAPLKIPATYIGPATLVLHKDNPSGMPENDASVSFPITIQY